MRSKLPAHPPFGSCEFKDNALAFSMFTLRTAMPHKSQPQDNFDNLPCVHPNYIRMVCSFIQKEGGDVHAVLSALGTSWKELEKLEQFVTRRMFSHIVRAAQQIAGRPTLALELGAQHHLAAHGMFGMALASSANLRQALTVIERFLPLRTANALIQIHRMKDGIWLQIQPQAHAGDLSAFVMDHIAASLSVIFSSITNQPPSAAVLEIPWAERSWSHAYAKLAGHLRFQTGRMAFFLPNGYLDLPCPTASASTFDMAWRQCEAEEKVDMHRITMVGRVTELLRSGNPEMFHIEVAARHMAISRSTLLRHLHAEGTSFKTQVEAERRHAAVWQLRYSDKPVAEIATSLGYRDVTNFSRSFRRWFGSPPSAMRDGTAAWPQEISF